MTPDELAALEEAMRWGECLAYIQEDQNRIDDADMKRAKVATIRNIIARYRGGGERAQIVAWLRGQCRDPMLPDFAAFLSAYADAIASGAHLPGQGE